MVRLTEQKQVLRATSKSPDVVSVAVIGCGYWGPNLVRNFFEAPASTVSAVCDLNQDRLAGIAKRYPTIALTMDYRDIVRDPDIDAVAIATPVSTHYRLAKEALEAGKNVWVEKPLTARYTEAQRLTELAEQKNLVLMVDDIFVYTGAVQRIRKSIEAAESATPYP